MNDLHGQAMQEMKILHGQAMQAVSELRRDVVSKLDQILALRRDPDERPN